jgi:predicted site-specific integrase-resolvase
MNAAQEYWDTKTTAKVLSVNTKTLLSLIEAGLIPVVKLTSKLYRFEPAKVREAMSKLSTGGAK